MKEKVYIALQTLEKLLHSQTCENKESYDSLLFCSETMRELAALYFYDDSENEIVAPSGSSLDKILRHLDKNHLKSMYPDLEDKSLEIAIKKISGINFDTSDFDKEVNQIIQDVNDQVILQLIGF